VCQLDYLRCPGNTVAVGTTANLRGLMTERGLVKVPARPGPGHPSRGCRRRSSIREKAAITQGARSDRTRARLIAGEGVARDGSGWQASSCSPWNRAIDPRDGMHTEGGWMLLLALLTESRHPLRLLAFGGCPPVPLYHRSALLAGHRFDGPAIIAQDDTTTCVLPGCEAVVDEYGNLLLSLQ